jgi:hypothetical protein
LNEKPKVCTQRAELGTKTGPSSNNVLKNFPNPSKIVDRKLSVSFGTLTMHTDHVLQVLIAKKEKKIFYRSWRIPTCGASPLHASTPTRRGATTTRYDYDSVAGDLFDPEMLHTQKHGGAYRKLRKRRRTARSGGAERTRR